MGRYTSVQAYADNHPSMRNVAYEQAAGAATAKKAVVKTEKVNNPYGSTAGAGSGEFHVYRHARSREMERLTELDREEREKVLEEEFRLKVEQNKAEEESRTEKRKRKRQRAKEAKMRKKNLKETGIVSDVGVKVNAKVAEDEFEYEPIRKNTGETKEDLSKEPSLSIPNDGSFLEMMKKRLANDSHQDEKKTLEDFHSDTVATKAVENENNGKAVMTA